MHQSINQTELAVSLQNIEMTFQSKGKKPFKVLQNLSFQIAKGQVFCLLGPNGSGKTTTINLINGLLRPTKGEIGVLGLNPSQNRRKVLSQIALVPQETALYTDLTAYENLMFHGCYYGVSKQALPNKIEEMIQLVQLKGREHDKVSTYSGGMQRRLALARALLTEPELLLLDEPTLGVDVQSRNAIWEQIRGLASSGKSVLLTTNYMEEAEVLGDQILIMDQGVPLISGTLQELKQQLNQKTLTFRFDRKENAEKFALQVVPNYKFDINENELKIHLSDVEQAMNIVRALSSQKGDTHDLVNGFELKEPNLQDVFLHFTGRALRD
ncbi:ATP-binding cassette domain-containing protein [Lysinibacillus sp. LZ02]|uniref:ABC transporter ATP-binding protein n=1 Tax=Lysinibacillus sp. LZ02 TaxID=3420668 RepID=UPI003D36FFCF